MRDTKEGIPFRGVVYENRSRKIDLPAAARLLGCPSIAKSYWDTAFIIDISISRIFPGALQGARCGSAGPGRRARRLRGAQGR